MANTVEFTTNGCLSIPDSFPPMPLVKIARKEEAAGDILKRILEDVEALRKAISEGTKWVEFHRGASAGSVNVAIGDLQDGDTAALQIAQEGVAHG